MPLVKLFNLFVLNNLLQYIYFFYYHVNFLIFIFLLLINYYFYFIFLNTICLELIWYYRVETSIPDNAFCIILFCPKYSEIPPQSV